MYPIIDNITLVANQIEEVNTENGINNPHIVTNLNRFSNIIIFLNLTNK